MSPNKQRYLPFVIFLDQRQHKPNKSNTIQTKWQESMVSDEESEGFNLVEKDSKVVEETFTVEKVIGSYLKVKIVKKIWRKLNGHEPLTPIYEIFHKKLKKFNC
jgi:hypothetical protein